MAPAPSTSEQTTPSRRMNDSDPTTASTRVLELKRQALALKNSGDVDGAKQCLAQARELEFQNMDMGSLADPKQLQQLTLFLKNRGDLEGAKAALIKAKTLQQPPQKPTDAPAATAPTSLSPSANERNDREPTTERKNDSTTERAEIGTAGDQNLVTNNEEDEALLAELMAEGGEDGEINFDAAQVTFSTEELQDEEMMVEFKIGGMPVPTNEVYQARILESKKAALASKNAGDLASAKEHLRQAKQLETVRIALSHQMEGELGLRINEDGDGWIEELNDEERELMGEAFLGAAASKRKSTTAVLELDDLDNMDAGMLLDMMQMGIAQVPSVDSVLNQAKEKKESALQLKNKGDVENAKVALLESKKLQAQAIKLRDMLREAGQLKAGSNSSGGGGGISDEALDALLNGGNAAPAEREVQQRHHESGPPSAKKPKTAEELKEEAVRLRNENNMVEATKVFRLYKLALQKEAEAAELVCRNAMIEEIQNERPVTQQQLRLLTFYHRFVDETVGAQQLKRWNEYEAACAKAMKFLEHPGESKTIAITRNDSFLMCLDDQNISGFVELGSDPNEARLEVSVLDIRNLHENRTMQKVRRHQKQQTGSIRVNMSIHLPPSEEKIDQSIDLTFLPSSREPAASTEGVYHFEGTQYVELPRGDSKYAKKILQRMERRRATVSVFHISESALNAAANKPAKGGWFWSSSKQDDGKDDDDEEHITNTDGITLLGKVVIELKDLLTRNCIAGDFALVSAGSRPVGGMIALCLRTGIPFDPKRQQDEQKNGSANVLIPYKGAMSFPSSKAAESSAT